MNFKKRLLLILLIAAVILTVPYFYSSIYKNHDPLSGPSYIDGWYLNTSTNASDYISETIMPSIMPKNFCSDKGILLVMINVASDKFEARNAIRETWGQKRENISFYFLMGQDKEHNYEVQLKIQEESQKYNDVIQERFIDTYNNLTLKSINMLKLFNLYCLKNFKYLMKIDDDVFVNVPLIQDYLTKRNNHTNLLVGRGINCSKPYRDPSSKWYVPYAFYSGEHYPDYICGPIYVMSGDVAQKLYRCVYDTPLFFIEDVYITGICAKKSKIIPQNHPEIICLPVNKYICLHRHRYALHFFKPNDIRTAYKTLEQNICPPEGSFTEWFTSLFYYA